jgi:hypothetical protein
MPGGSGSAALRGHRDSDGPQPASDVTEHDSPTLAGGTSTAARTRAHASGPNLQTATCVCRT